MSDPYVRDIITIKANPSLASQAPIDKRITLINRDCTLENIIFIGIRMANLNISLSNAKSDISK
jgi:hypothetical protein